MNHNLLAAAIAHMEGFYIAHTLARRNNNPGNLRTRPPYYNTYPTAEDGWTALVSDIDANTGMCLSDFIAKYAPPVENNTTTYLEAVLAITGYQPSDLL